MTTGFQHESYYRGLTDDEIKWLIDNYRGSSWLEQQLYSYINSRRISQEEAATIFDTVTNQVPIRERQLSAWEQRVDKQTEAWKQKQQVATQERKARETHLSYIFEEFEKNPVVAPYLNDIRQSEIDAFLSGQSGELLPKLSQMWTGAYEAQKAQVRESAEAQRAQRQLASMGGVGETPKEQWVRPPVSGTEDVTKGFLEETGLGTGTRLRNFLEGEFIPGIAEETRGAREQWWQRMHPEPSGRETYDEERRRVQEEAFRWGQMAYGPGQASSEAYLGDTYYGEGGLRATAERAYRTALGRLGEMKPDDTEEVWPKPGPDPLIAALREKKFRPEYYRGAGTGLVSRLTPSVRY